MRLYIGIRIINLSILLMWLLNSCSPFSKADRKKDETFPFERPTKTETEIVGRLFWRSDSEGLYFASRAAKNEAGVSNLRFYDLQNKEVDEFPTGGYGILFSRSNEWNECDEVVASAIDYDQKKMGFALSSKENIWFHRFNNIDLYSEPIWLTACTEVLLIGCNQGSERCGMFLWRRNYDEPRPVTPFVEISSEGKRYAYQRFAQTFVQGRVVFDYYVYQKPTDRMTYHFGAMDVRTGKAWEIIDHGEGVNMRIDASNWFVSKTEDAIYFFQRDESYFFDSLWKADSSGAQLTKVLSGEDIGRPYWHTYVSWSGNGERFVFFVDPCEDERFKGTYMVDVKTKEVRQVIPNQQVKNYALSPDGKRLAYALDNNIFIMDLQTNEEQRIYSLN